MPIVSAVCPSCGATLDVDNSKDAGICQYCGNPFVMETAVTNYNIKYEVKADTVIVNNRATMEELIEREEVYLRLNETDRLSAVYEEMTKLYPKRYEGWWGKIILFTNRFTDLDADIEQITTWYDFVHHSADSSVKPNIEKQYHSYLLAREQLRLERFDNNHKNRINKLQTEMQSELQASKASAGKSWFLLILLLILESVSYRLFRWCIDSIKNAEDPGSTGGFVFLIVVIVPVAIAILVIFFKSQEFSYIGAAKRNAKDIEKKIGTENAAYKETRKEIMEQIQALQTKVNA